MGVKDLWSILEPVKCHKSLAELSGQTIAVDLSIWICETQGVRHMQGVVVKPYLRNLFFRVSHLMQLGVKLVFVLEGAAPELKWEAMMQRQQIRFSGRPGNGCQRSGKVKRQGRSRFKVLVKECGEMLQGLGIPCLQSQGEAEAFCALLNQHGHVDGVLTNDGDAFLYGARKVYRNFTMNNKDPHVESYQMKDIEDKLGLDRTKLVSLALLLGCDYEPKGVPGVGKEQALKLMAALGNINVLGRFQEWRSNVGLAAMDQCVTSKKPAHCRTCGHPGSAKEHSHHGCQWCRSSQYCEPCDYDFVCPCKWHQQNAAAQTHAIELAIRRKALLTPQFPNQQIIDEFIRPKDNVPKQQFVWKRPKMFHLQRFNLDKLEWPEDYSQVKILPLVTLWDMRDRLHSRSANSQRHMQPHCVVKTRVRQGMACLEIQWHKVDGDTTTDNEYYTTIEEREMFEQCFPNLVHDFEQQKALKPTRVRKPKGTKEKETDTGISTTIEGMKHLSLSSQSPEILVTKETLSGMPCDDKKEEHGQGMPTIHDIQRASSSDVIQDKQCLLRQKQSENCEGSKRSDNPKRNELIAPCQNQVIVEQNQMKIEQTTKDVFPRSLNTSQENAHGKTAHCISAGVLSQKVANDINKIKKKHKINLKKKNGKTRSAKVQALIEVLDDFSFDSEDESEDCTLIQTQPKPCTLVSMDTGLNNISCVSSVHKHVSDSEEEDEPLPLSQRLLLTSQRSCMQESKPLPQEPRRKLEVNQNGSPLNINLAKCVVQQNQTNVNYAGIVKTSRSIKQIVNSCSEALLYQGNALQGDTCITSIKRKQTQNTVATCDQDIEMSNKLCHNESAAHEALSFGKEARSSLSGQKSPNLFTSDQKVNFKDGLKFRPVQTGDDHDSSLTSIHLGVFQLDTSLLNISSENCGNQSTLPAKRTSQIESLGKSSVNTLNKFSGKDCQLESCDEQLHLKREAALGNTCEDDKENIVNYKGPSCRQKNECSKNTFDSVINTKRKPQAANYKCDQK